MLNFICDGPFSNSNAHNCCALSLYFLNVKLHNIVKNHECCLAAKAYAEMVKNWFDSSEELFEEKADDLSLQARLELPDSDQDSISKQAWLIAIRMTQCDIRNTNEIRFTNN